MQLTLLYVNDYSIARWGKSRKEFPPIGLLYLAAACEKSGVKVRLIDLLSKEFHELDYSELIGLSINSSYVYPNFKKQIKRIRNLCKYLIIGGQHPTIFPKETFLDLEPDIIVMGEGENTVPKLVKLLETIAPQNIDSLPSVVNSANLYSAKYSSNLRINNLDMLEFPARYLLDESDVLLDKRIYNENVKSISIITSRGCHYSCKFCGNIYKSFEHRSIQNIDLEIKQILEDYPQTGGIVFLDENLLFNATHAKSICEIMIKYPLKWTCNARVDCFTEGLITQLHRSGCVEIKYGIESGSQAMLDKMNKKISLMQISNALRETKKVGIRTKCFMMFGYPGDSLDSAKETIDFLENHKEYIDRVNLFSFAPLPSSPIYKELREQCHMIEFDKYKIYHQFDHWWGSQEDFKNLTKGYKLLHNYIKANYEK